MKRILKVLMVAGFSSCLGLGVEAASLVEVYRDALAYDPTFKAAKAEWLANQENLAIVRADLLPSITAGTSLGRVKSNQINGYNKSLEATSFNNSWHWNVNLTQPLFDFSKLSSYFANKANVKAAYMKYLAAESDLLFRVAEAYLTVLAQEDILAYNQANCSATKKLLDQAKRKYEVGLVAVTDYEEAQARYDAALAGEIEAQNNVYIAKENLWVLTGQQYDNLNGLTDKFILISPHPKNMEEWVKQAVVQNFNLKAAKYASQAAYESIRTAQANHLPVVNGQIAYEESTDRKHSRSSTIGGGYDTVAKEKDKGLTGVISAQMSLFAGGKVIASAKQAEYLYEQALAMQEQTYRKVVSDTRSAYLTTQSYVDKVRADQQALRSIKSSLKSTQASYLVGRRTMADVLDQQAELYNRQSVLAKDEYSYIVTCLKLKQLVSTLNVGDLEEINQWLSADPTKKVQYLNLHQEQNSDLKNKKN